MVIHEVEPNLLHLILFVECVTQVLQLLLLFNGLLPRDVSFNVMHCKFVNVFKSMLICMITAIDM